MGHGPDISLLAPVSSIMFLLRRVIHYLNAIISGGTCGTLQDPVNGNVHITSINLGGRAIYSCNQGFVLMGTHARVCGVLGTWTDSAPICLRK